MSSLPTAPEIKEGTTCTYIDENGLVHFNVVHNGHWMTGETYTRIKRIEESIVFKTIKDCENVRDY